jgi:DNA-binding transcriptional MerR regulator
MRIGELADLVGVDPPTIRFYEAEGVLPPPARRASGYRDYGPADVERLRFVKRARTLGLALDDIREILALRDRGDAPCRHVRTVIAREAADIRRRIEELQLLEAELRRLAVVAEQLGDTNPAEPCVCHIIDAVEVRR